jgi:hypothetical protein
MHVFIFQSQSDAGIVGITAQRDGKNLPGQYAPWKAIGNGALQSGGSLAGITEGADHVLAAIAKDGYFLARANVRVAQGPTRTRH